MTSQSFSRDLQDFFPKIPHGYHFAESILPYSIIRKGAIYEWIFRVVKAFPIGTLENNMAYYCTQLFRTVRTPDTERYSH